MIKPRVGCYAVYEPSEEGWQDLDLQFLQVNTALQSAGLEVISAPEPVCDDASCERVSAWLNTQNVDLLHALMITWSFDHYTVRIQGVTRRPVAIRCLPGIRSGSLVGGQQLASLLTDLEVEQRIYYGPTESGAVAQETAHFALAAALRNLLSGARIGVIGRRTVGMTPIAVDEVEILRLFGARLWPLDMNEFDELAGGVSEADARREWERVSSRASAVSCDAASGLASMRSYLAIKRLAAERSLQAVTVGSYPQCLGTACLPLALLNDEGLPAGCEGDINATILMLILSQLGGGPAHFGEMLAIDEQENSVVSSHCGAAAPSFADSRGYILCPVRLAHSGVCIRSCVRPGPVTYANLVGRKGNYRMCALEGQAIPTEMVFEGNPLRFQLKTPFRQVWRVVAEHGFGHHWMAVYDHVVPVLAEFCRLTGIQGIFPDLERETRTA